MSILDRIVADTTEIVTRRAGDVPINRLEDMPHFDRTPIELGRALRTGTLSVIAEVKKASPSRGLIRADFDPADAAARYAEAGAAAVSVLTEPLHFQGSLEDLASVRVVVPLPLLRKDFVIDEYQLFEARAYGADAVLLIAAVLDRGHLRDLLQAAAGLGLSALVEIYELNELDRVDFDEVSLVGVNNRNLHTFEVDVDHSIRVFEHVPDHVVRVSESGLSSAVQLVRLYEHGVDAVLIGETFMRATNPGAALKTLLKEFDQELETARAHR